MNIYNEENKPKNEKGFEPEVNNAEISAKKSNGWLIILFFILTLGLFGIYYIVKKNELNALQLKVNESASGIEIQLAKRRDTLVKLLDTTKSLANYEKTLISDITNLRSKSININNQNEINEETNRMFSNFFAVAENYPELKADKAFISLMNTADYLEKEIAASRRTYNSNVNKFNTMILTWPSSYLAAKNGYTTIKLFEASEEQLKDVNLSF